MLWNRIILVSLASALGLVLSGCAAQLPVQTVSTVTPTNGAGGIDVYKERRQRGEDVPAFAGDQIIEVRAYEETNEEMGEAAGREIAQVGCTVKARDFVANIVTPAKVRVPIYQKASSPLSIECQKQGYRNTLVTTGVYNLTKEQRLNAGSHGGLAGVLVMAAVNGMSDDSTHDFRYQSTRVVMPRERKRRKTASAQ